MDITKLGLKPKKMIPTETVAKIDLTYPNGEAVTTPSGEPMWVEILLSNTPEGKREIRKWMVRTGGFKDTEKPDATEEEAELIIDRQDTGNAELVSRLVQEWNLTDDKGRPVECSFENRKAFFGYVAGAGASEQEQDLGALCEHLRFDVLAKMGEASNTLGNAKKA